MSITIQRRIVVLGLLSVVVAVMAALGQPKSPWTKAAAFPEPDEELYGVVVNGKLHVIGGWGGGKGRGANYVYDPASDQWTKKNL